jgi:hypothetical protein
VTVAHLPPGTRTYFTPDRAPTVSHITLNWRGRPLTSHQVIVDLFANTTTATGLSVRAVLDTGQYPTGISYTDKDIAALPRHGGSCNNATANTTRSQSLGNYVIVDTEAAFASLAGAAPLPASSGNTVRHRLSRNGDRQLNCALDVIARFRMSNDPATRAYVERRTAEGKTRSEIRRCLKRCIARQIFRQLQALTA